MAVRRKTSTPRARNAFPIVGVGASAGGLEAFRQLLAALPVTTGMAYVLVQHLASHHESILAELLAKGSRLAVSEVKEDTVVEANHVYVTPGQQDLALDGGMLKLVPRTNTRGQHLPIDSFLRTLAAAHGSKAIAVILSGTGSDGTLGVKAIKEAGGIAFAQEPRSAGYDGMPRSAIASGAVDFVLPPDKVAQELARLSRHPYVVTTAREAGPAAPVSKGRDALGEVLTLLHTATGTDFSSYKAPTIRRRIARRMALIQVDTLRDYARYLEGHADEVQALYRDSLIRVTSFFRDPGAFEVLCDEALPRLLKDRPSGAPIRMWMPGCATGEEVYSIVMCLLERTAEAKVPLSFQVFATDLSDGALEEARAASYPENIVQDVSAERLARFFTKADGRYRVHKSVRDLCVFARHDLTRDPPFSRMDLISCRNLLIYLGPRQQQKVLALFHRALQPNGVLLLGGSETVGGSDKIFAPLHKKHRIYVKRAAALPPGPASRAPVRGAVARRPRAGPAGKSGGGDDLRREADRILLARYAPGGVILDAKDEIVEFRGQTEPYLEHSHGRASLNLFKMARPELLIKIRQAVRDARTTDAPVRKQGVPLRQRGPRQRIDVVVVPLKGSPEKERSLLVLFESHPEVKAPRAGRTRTHRADALENAKLRQDLAEAARHLQVVTEEQEGTYEELQSANEEGLSANEELQSINEELETAKEELQASNQELGTLNQELQDRNLQLGRALEFANGIVETVRNPLMILDAGLRVERVNRAFYDYFQVAAEETIGRLVFELGDGQWDIPALRQALDGILPKAAPVEGFEVDHEFPRVGRRTLVVNARKLHRESGQESILLAFEDRTKARSTEKERESLLRMEQQARQRAEQADRIKDEFVATLSHELRGPLSAMVGWVHALRAGGVDEAIRERGMAAIERSVKTQARLIEDLLDYARVVAGKLHLAPQATDLFPVAGAAIEAVRSAAEAKGIRLDLVTDSQPAIVHGDPDRLQQILWNLLSNAVKFTPRGGRVEIWIGRVDMSLHVQVSDTGQGISRDFLPHVFERFRQEDGTPKRLQGGLGLGLAIVKELVELHGGTVQAESPGEGKGSTLTVALPIPMPVAEPAEGLTGPPDSLVPTRARVAGERSALEGVRLLVVEDEPDGREMLVTLFRQSGAHVIAAASAGEAIAAMQQGVPDVLVCDIGLPGEDGHELIRQLRALEGETGGRVPALALTAYREPEERGKALAAGFDLHLSKAAAPEEVVAKAALLAGSRVRPKWRP